MLTTHLPLVLVILDGWGYREDPHHNAIKAAQTPVLDELWNNYPHALISGSGAGVGLPNGQMGNSEVGHLNIGAGRIIHQEFTRIDNAIEDGSFFQNEILNVACQKARDNNKAVHILGLLSPGGVHSHERQLAAMIEMAAKLGCRVYLHAFLDGRDTPPKSAKPSLEKINKLFKQLNANGQIASICGRFYAMDRDNRWDRTKEAYDLLTLGNAPFQATNAIDALDQAYARNESDEFVKPTCILDGNHHAIKIEDGDAIVFMNFRSDRARQLTRAFAENDFVGFERKALPKLCNFITLTQYAFDLNAHVAFPSVHPDNSLGEYLSNLGLKQLRIAETEKYAHVTFFFNGGIEKPFPGEDRILVPSPPVKTYDLKPEMSAYQLTQLLVEKIQSHEYAVIICNFANPDMVGHTGDFAATVKAIEVIDHCIGEIATALKNISGELVITADHGNAEFMFDEQTGQAHTAHTSQPVPFIYMGRPAKITQPQGGILADIAPTLLHILGLSQPKEMTGKSLVTL
jgi:2,3-bisphosphoglycerate-independent phosphoglycerate mutase